MAQDKIALARLKTATDRQIDSIVYDLYGLTEDEIQIVERAVSTKSAPKNSNNPNASGESQ